MDKKLIALISIFVFSFLLFISIIFINNPTQNLARASKTNDPSAQNSIIIAWPLSSNVYEKKTIEINVFARDKDNRPLEGKNVVLKTTLGSINQNNIKSEKKTGKATFILTSNKTGIAEISAAINNIELEKKVTIKFE